jgi:hypothetical protein
LIPQVRSFLSKRIISSGNAPKGPSEITEPTGDQPSTSTCDAYVSRLPEGETREAVLDQGDGRSVNGPTLDSTDQGRTPARSVVPKQVHQRGA